MGRADGEVGEAVAVRVADGEGDAGGVGGVEPRAGEAGDDDVDDREVLGLVEGDVARAEIGAAGFMTESRRR
jgi:hypothetical protein